MEWTDLLWLEGIWYMCKFIGGLGAQTPIERKRELQRQERMTPDDWDLEYEVRRKMDNIQTLFLVLPAPLDVLYGAYVAATTYLAYRREKRADPEFFGNPTNAKE